MAKGNRPVDPNQKYEHSLFWTEPMLELIQKHAVRTDESLSFIVQTAWKAQYATIATSDRETLAAVIRPFEGNKAKQSLYYTGAMILQFAEQAARLDSSESFVVQAAVALSTADFEKLPHHDDR